MATTQYGLFIQYKNGTLVSQPWMDYLPLTAVFPKLGTVALLNDSGTIELRAMDTLMTFATIDATQADRWFAFSPDGRFDHSSNSVGDHYWDRGAVLVPVLDSDPGHTPALLAWLFSEESAAQAASVQPGVDVQDSGFESPTVSNGQSKEDLGGLPWQGTTGPNGHWGIANGAGHWGNGAAEGDQFAYLNREVTLTQTLSGLTPGNRYRISFKAMRGGEGGNGDAEPLTVVVDGHVVLARFTPFNRFWERFRSSVFTATSSTCKLEFRAEDIGLDAVDAIDEVHLLAVPAKGSIVSCREPTRNRMAERVGFEPTIRFKAGYTLSRRAPSTTRTPLRTGRY